MLSISSTQLRGIMMILSPAKTLDLSPTTWPMGLTPTVADCDPSKTLEVANALKKRKESELEKLLGISKTLAKTAKEYWTDFAVEEEKRDIIQRKPCIYSFSGAAYQGLQATECDEAAMSYLQENLRIIDPLYGVLRPLDRMQPYRLEMATKNVLSDRKVKLADYWKESVTRRLSEDLEAHADPRILLNLASDEYAAAVDPSALPENAKYVKVIFREEGRVIAVHAKRARGLMVRYLAENEVDSLEAIQQFAEEGYSFVPSKSDETTLVFDRKKGSGTKRASSTKATKTKRVKR